MREKKDRNNLIIQKLNRNEYGVDIAKEFKISPAMVSKIKGRYFDRVQRANPDTPDLRDWIKGKKFGGKVRDNNVKTETER